MSEVAAVSQAQSADAVRRAVLAGRLRIAAALVMKAHDAVANAGEHLHEIGLRHVSLPGAWVVLGSVAAELRHAADDPVRAVDSAPETWPERLPYSFASKVAREFASNRPARRSKARGRT